MFGENAERGTGGGAIGLLLLGPFLGLLYICFFPAIALLMLVFALPQYATAKSAGIVENSPCMACHSSRELFGASRDKDRLHLYVDAAAFSGSVHNVLSCTDCHQKISLDSHPGDSDFRSRKAVSVEVAAACATCHPDALSDIRSVHGVLNGRSNAPPCTECHGSHAVKHVAEWKTALTGNKYCLTCHSRKISKTLPDGERLSLLVEASDLSASVHNGHACDSCHEGYSGSAHPLNAFKDGRERSITVSQTCWKCHADKKAAVKGSIHYELLMHDGNRNAPVCTDCHGFHSVGPKATYDTLAGVPCRKCHENIFKVYSQSVHGRARERGQHEAPLCFSCHFAHEIQAASFSEKMRNACIGCHREVETRHREWLPNAELHLSSVACAACHSPQSDKGVSLRLYDEATNKPFTEEDIKKIMGPDYDKLAGRLGAHGEGIDAEELWGIIRSLKGKGAAARVTFMGLMDVTDGLDAHRLGGGGKALRECGDCHSGDSKHFRNVTVAIVRADGRMLQYRAKPEVLGSMISIFSMKQFYVLGGTRLRLLDWLGLAMVLGGIILPMGHITLRILTAPLRKGRGRGTHGKEDGR